jgi:hypothetical protein
MYLLSTKCVLDLNFAPIKGSVFLILYNKIKFVVPYCVGTLTVGHSNSPRSVIEGSGSIPPTNGSGRPKNMWIRIRNTGKKFRTAACGTLTVGHSNSPRSVPSLPNTATWNRFPWLSPIRMSPASENR